MESNIIEGKLIDTLEKDYNMLIKALVSGNKFESPKTPQGSGSTSTFW